MASVLNVAPRRAYDRWKRATDITLSATGLVVTAPIQVAVAIVVRWKLGSPVLFRQHRPGLHDRPFLLLKFRTMLPVDGHAGLVTDSDRMTTLGQFLRSTSLDELPTLWNVVRGDMSLVGPRPLLMSYLERYTPEQARRHEVRPGITGLAQIAGRNSLSWEAKLANDVAYVDNRGFVLDLKILARTFVAVARRTGISADGNATMPEFLGGNALDGGRG